MSYAILVIRCLLDLLCAYPVLSRRSLKLIDFPRGRWPCKWRMAAWPIEGCSEEGEW